MKIKLEKGFKQFLVKTVIFVVLFAIIQIVIIPLQEINLPIEFYPVLDTDLGKALLFTAVTFILLIRKNVFKLEEHKFKLGKSLLFGLLTLLSLAAYFIYKYLISKNINFALKYLIFFLPLKYVLILAILIFLVFSVFGVSFLSDFIKKFKKEFVICIVLFFMALFLIIEFQRLWPYFSWIVAKLVYYLLKLTSEAHLYFKQELPIMEINEFRVGIDSPCSGIDSMILFTFLYIFAVILDWKLMNKKKVALMFLPGLIGTFVLNILRVYFLILIGAYVSQDFALGLFHTSASMILFLIYFAGFWILFYKWMKDEKSAISKDSLYSNSFYLMLNTLVISFLGFVFWMINTRLFTTEQVGLATTIISVTTLIASFSVLGLNFGLIRYLPKSKEKNHKINTSFTLVSLITIIISTVFLLCLKNLSPNLLFIKENAILSFIFIIFMIFSSLNSLIESVFIAFRSAKYIFLKGLIFGILKIIFPFFLVSLGAYGIFGSYMIPMIMGCAVSLIILIYKFNYKPSFVFHDSIIKQIWRYSFGNYIAGFIGNLPVLLFPLIITNSLGPKITAYYSMALMIASAIFLIPQATSSSLFAEGSNNEKNLKQNVKKAAKIISLLLIPAVIFILLLGKYILLLLGQNYSNEGYGFLSLLAFSGIFVSINYVFTSVFNVKKKVKELIFRSSLEALVILGLSFIFIQQGLSLLGVGYAWIIGKAVTSLVFIGMWLLKK